jgi:hypothetical protein
MKRFTSHFDQQLYDIISLARIIHEDRLWYGDKQYGPKEINRSFQKFFYNKGLTLDFKEQQDGGGGQSGLDQVIEDLKRSRLNYFS